MSSRRKRRFFRLSRAKDWLMIGWDFALRRGPKLSLVWCERLLRLLGLLMKLLYLLPGGPIRRCTRNICTLRLARGLDGPQSSPMNLFLELVDRVVVVLQLYLRLEREGADAVAERISIDPQCERVMRELHEKHGSALLLVPHCAGSALSSCAVARRFPTLVLVRESANPRRAEILKRTLLKMGAQEMLFLRHMSPQAIARRVLEGFRAGRMVIGTTDLARKAADRLEAPMFGVRVFLPSWPARFAGRKGVPIMPGYVTVRGGRPVILGSEPYIESNALRSTAKWAQAFERHILASPADWVFMFDKRWDKVLAQAARKVRLQRRRGG